MPTTRARLRKRKHKPHKATEGRRLLQTSRWEQLSKWYRQEHPTCERCGDRASEQVHHKIPREIRPDLTFTDWNLLAVCRPCHQILEND